MIIYKILLNVDKHFYFAIPKFENKTRHFHSNIYMTISSKKETFYFKKKETFIEFLCFDYPNFLLNYYKY